MSDPIAKSKEPNAESERERRKALLNMHKMFLEAMRHREQEIVRFLAILGPALGGFAWLATKREEHPDVFLLGTLGVLFVLVIGALYALALGYNYRYLTLQLAKIEAEKQLDLKEVTLQYWPKDPKGFIKGNRIGVIPWSTPPGIIHVFWLTFVLAIAGVTAFAYVLLDTTPITRELEVYSNLGRVRHGTILMAGGGARPTVRK